MSHIILFAEGYSDALRQFETELNGRTYADGKSKLRIREIKLYDISYNNCAEQEILNDFIGLEKQFDIGDNAHPFKWGKLFVWFNRLGRMFGIKPIDRSQFDKSTKFGKSRADGGINYNAHFYIIGKTNDYVDQNGDEQV